jgi:2-polyprenyl-6-hydroxyphenyl methylase/3-demethylubiquinone-9 3-methyltransferase
MSTDHGRGYVHGSSACNCSHDYLLPAVLRELERLPWHAPRRVFDLGCGSGAVANALSTRGYRVTGVDPSTDGIARARAAYPTLDLHLGSAYDELAARFGSFPAVVSLEVVEHVYDPRTYAASVYALLEPGGTAIISTPYHGYLKNLAIALANKTDAHVNPLWDHGHIKFWSIRTLSVLLREAGFRDLRFERVGRIRALAKSMIAIVRK